MKKINPLYFIFIVFLFLTPVVYLLYYTDNTKQTILNTSISSSNTNTNELALTILESLKTKEYTKIDFLHCKMNYALEDRLINDRFLKEFKTKILDYNFENSQIMSVTDSEITISGGMKPNSELVSERLLFNVKDQKFRPDNPRSINYKCFMVDTSWK
jgi:hypothetical protein